MSMKRLAVAMMAVLGLGAGHTASVQQVAAQSVRQVADAKTGQTTNRELRSDIFGRYVGGLLSQQQRNACPPHIWGQSDACRRMVRKNRLLFMGLSSARI